ncbi:MAG: HAD-IIA family hydrolase [Candidatus Thorarchaeota archaeon]
MDLEQKRLWLFDVDNTLVRDIEHPEVFPDALNLWNHLESLGRTNAILTNVGRLSSRQIHSTLTQAGFSLTRDRTFGAGAAAAAYVFNRSPGARCFVISEGGATEDFVARGLNVTNNPPVEYVAVAADRGLTFQELNFATKMVQDGATLICVSGSLKYGGVYLGNEDVFIGERSIVTAIEHATGVEAVVVGKPMPEIFVETVTVLGFEVRDAVMVGDNPHSDIAGGNAAGMTTILVNHSRSSDEVSDPRGLDTKPDFSVSSLDEIVALL